MARIDDIEIMDDFPGFPTVVVRASDVSMDQLPAFMDSAFSELRAAIENRAFVPDGPAFSRYDAAPGATVTLETGFPVTTPLAGPVGRVEGSSLPACRLATTRYRGGYDGLADAWKEFLTRIGDRGLEAHLPYWEAYDTQPTPDMDPADLVTGLAAPVSNPR